MPTYSDAEMRAIMGRALQIDSGRSDRFTPEQLRTIAAELGISTQALEVAMYEADSRNTGIALGSQGSTRRPGFAKGLAIAFAVLLVIAAGAIGFHRVAPRQEIVQAREDRPATGGAAPARALRVEAVPTKVTTKKVR